MHLSDAPLGPFHRGTSVIKQEFLTSTFFRGMLVLITVEAFGQLMANLYCVQKAPVILIVLQVIL